MTTKPITLPEWATSGAIVEPSSGKKVTGFVGGEQPPAEFFNWLLNLIYTWTQYLDRPDGITLGQDFVDTEAHALTARLTAAPASNSVTGYTLLGSWGDARIWIGSSVKLALVLTYNATRPADASGNWAKITASQPATALFIQRSRVVVASMPLAQNTAWTDAFVIGEGTTAGWGRSLDLPADPKQDTKAQSDVARYTQQVSNTSGVKRVLQLHFKYPTVGDVRLYYCTVASEGDSGAFEIILNAGYDNTADTWTYDRTHSVHKFIFSSTRLGVKFMLSGEAGSTFTDADWTTAPVDFQWQTGANGANKYNMGNGRLRFVGTESTTVDDANPPATIAALPANTIHAKNICKSFGSINNVAGGVSIEDGYNLETTTGIARNTTTNRFTVTFETAMQNALYSVNVTCGLDSTSAPCFAVIVSRATTNFVIEIYRQNTAGAVLGVPASQILDVDTIDIIWTFDVFGRQDS